MKYDIKITPAAEVPSLRHGFAFEVTDESGTQVATGRIKPSGVRWDKRSKAPATARVAIEDMARKWLEKGAEPESSSVATAAPTPTPTPVDEAE